MSAAPGIQVQPIPTPIQWALGTVDLPDGSKQVFMQIMMVTGSTFIFLTPMDAKNMAASLEEVASTAQASASTLLTPPHPLLGPDGRPISFVPNSNGRAPSGDQLPASPTSPASEPEQTPDAD